MKYRLFACLLSLAFLLSCGGSGGGSGGNATNGNGGSTNTPPPTLPPAPPPAIPPTPPPEVQLTSTCPATNASAVGLNSWINASFDKDIDITSLDIDSVSLDCGGIIVIGQTIVDSGTIYFAPNQPIPSFQSCTVRLDPAIMDLDGVEIGNHSWTFQSGNKEATALQFDIPRSLTTGANGLIRKVASEDNDIAILWNRGSSLYITSSQDGGQSFITSPPINTLNGFGSVEEVDAKISGGVLHIAWRVLPVNAGAEIIYAHSETDFSSFSLPLILTIPNDLRNAFSPSLTINSAGDLYIAWNEICRDSASCNSDSLGVFSVVSTDGGDSFGAVVKLTSNFANIPQLASAGDQTLIAFKENDTLGLYAIAPLTGLRASFSETGQQIWPFQLEEGNNDKLFIHWKEGPGIGAQSFFLVRYSYQSQTASLPMQVIQESAQAPNICSLISAVSDDQIYWLTGFYDSARTQAGREISISTDGGDNFYYPQPLDFFFLAKAGSGALSDSICPSVIDAQNSEIILAWSRILETSPPVWDLMISRGIPSNPCSQL